jgi:hypothetical protein
VLTAARVASALDLPAVLDIEVVHNSSGRARAVRVRTPSGWRVFPGAVIRNKFHLGSTDFDLHALALDEPDRAVFGSSVKLTGFVRGLGRARLQQLTQAGWVTVRHLRVAADGRFAVTVRAAASTEFRLAYNGAAGDAVGLQVAPRVDVSADGSRLHARVSPALPLQVQRLTHAHWQRVASSRGVFDRSLRPGSYRIAVLGSGGYVPRISQPVSLRIS